MIALKSYKSDGSSFQVYEDDTLIGHILRQTGLNGDKFVAMIDVDGEEKFGDKAFDRPDDALQWIEKQK
jgi:hypothetical protein